ncbi:MAG: flavin reductase [Planctomycetota bacterium]
MQVDPTNLEPRDIYRLMISVIVPRPIAWVSTQSADGALNAAPFSYFQAIGGKPPKLMLVIGNRRTGEAKDTRRNIEATGEFVVNLVGESNGPAMVRTSVDHPYGVSEFEEVGLTPVPSERVAPPRIGESGVALECKLDRVLDLGSAVVIIGEIQLFHLADELLDEDGHVDPLRLRPLGRLGGQNYATIGELLRIDSEGRTESDWSVHVDLWSEMRTRSIAMVKAMSVEQLGRSAGGMTVGGMFLHMVDCARMRVFEWQERTDEYASSSWDPSWDSGRIAAVLESDRAAFLEACRVAPRDLRWKIDRMTRHEAWHQGQIALILREEFAEDELWML